MERIVEDKYMLDTASMQWKELEEHTQSNTELLSEQLENFGITCASGVRKLKTTPHLINLSRDPSLTGRLTFILEKGDTTIGSKKTACLIGLDIDHDQGTITNSDGALTFVNSGDAVSFVNGKKINLYDTPDNPDDIPKKNAPTKLHHGDRILFDNITRFLCRILLNRKLKLLVKSWGATWDVLPAKDWAFAMKERYKRDIEKKMFKEVDVRRATEEKAKLSSEKLKSVEEEMTSEKAKLKEWMTSAEKRKQNAPTKLKQEQDRIRHRIDQLERRLSEQLVIDQKLKSKMLALIMRKKLLNHS